MPHTAASAQPPASDQPSRPENPAMPPPTISARLAVIEAHIARLRAEQVELVDRARATPGYGDTGLLTGFIEAAADLSPDTADMLAGVAKSLPSHPMLYSALAHGDITFDRALELVRLAELGHAHSVDIGWMRSVAELRHLADIAECLMEDPAEILGTTTANLTEGGRFVRNQPHAGQLRGGQPTEHHSSHAVTTSSGA